MSLNLNTLSRILLWVTLLAGLQSCSTSPKIVKIPAPLVALSSPYSLKLLWQLRFDALKYSDSEGLYFAESKTHLYFANPDGVLTSALKAGNGRWTDQVSWQRKFGESIVSGPTLAKQGLIIGTAKGHLLLVKPENGALIWEAQLSSEVLSRAVVNDTTTFVRTVDGKLYSVNLATGHINWVAEHSLPSLSLRGIAPVTLVNNVLYVGWEDGQVEALDVNTGEMIWQAQVLIPHGRTDLERLIDIQAKLIYENGRLYVLGYHGKLVSLNPENGNLFWAKDVSGFRNFVVDKTALYMVNENDILMAYDLYSGTMLWKQENYKYRRLVDLIFYGKNQLLLADGLGYFHWVDKVDGTEIARAKHVEQGMPGQTIVRIWSSGNEIYTQDIQGYISVYQVVISDWYQFNHPNGDIKLAKQPKSPKPKNDN